MINVQPGTYTDSNLNFGGNSIILQSVGGPSVTIITNSNTNAIFVFQSGDSGHIIGNLNFFTSRNNTLFFN